MKTAVTIEVDDDVLADATREAERRNTTLSVILEELVRATLHHPKARTSAGRYYLPVFDPDVPGRPAGVPDDITFAQMMDILDDAEAHDSP